MASRIALGSIGGTTSQLFDYEGLSRLTKADDSGGSNSAGVEFFYDAINRIVEEWQYHSLGTGAGLYYITNTAFDSYPVAEFTYPNSRMIENDYDLLYRRIEVGEGTGGTSGSSSSGSLSIAAWEFFGPGRVAECTLGNGLIATHMNNDRDHSAVQETVPNPVWGTQSSDQLGFDGASRPITKRYLAGGIDGVTHAYNDTSAVVGETTAYDRASNKFYERELHAESRSHLYQPVTSGVPQGGYDSIDRLRQYQRGTLATGGGSVSTAIAVPNTDEDRTYDLDGLGNWHRTDYTPQGGALKEEVRQHNGLNEITRTTVDGGTPTIFAYDGTSGASNGNLADDGVRTYKYDALNRLIEVKKKSSGAVIGTYVYDALNRRVRKTVFNAGLSGNIPNDRTDYLYQGAQCVSEVHAPDDAMDPDFTTLRQYVWGIYNDELIQQLEYVPETSSSSSSGSSSSSSLSSSSSNISSSSSSSSPSSSSSSSSESSPSSGGMEFAATPPRRREAVPVRRSTFLATADEFTRIPYYPLCDILYRTVALTDDNGEIIQTYDTDAYGNTLIFTAPGTGNDWWANDAVQGDNPACRFIFTGRRYDPETELYYYRTRVYDSVAGRFLQRDPFLDVYVTNVFQFVDSNPLKLLDPLGLWAGAGLNHWYPLYLGGDNLGPVSQLGKNAHIDFHRYFQSQGIGYWGGKGSVAEAQARWKAMSPCLRKIHIMRAMRVAGASPQWISNYIDDVMSAELNAGIKTPRTGRYGTRIPLGPAVAAIAIVLIETNTAQAGEPTNSWRNAWGKDPSKLKGTCKCAEFSTIATEYSLPFIGVEPANEYRRRTQLGGWLDFGEVTAEECAMFEGTASEKVDSNWVANIYDIRDVECRFDPSERSCPACPELPTAM